MCFAVPGKIESIDGNNAKVDYGGVKRTADISFLEDITVGDYILVHVGFAIQKIDRQKGKETYKFLADNLN